MKKSKSQQVLEYLYRYAVEQSSFEMIEAMIPYGKQGMMLWEIGRNIYEIMLVASDEDRTILLSEFENLNPQEIEDLSSRFVEDANVIYPIHLDDDEKIKIARHICQTLKQLPHQKALPEQVIKSLNQSLFQGKSLLSVEDLSLTINQTLGSAVVKTLTNGHDLFKTKHRQLKPNHKQKNQLFVPKIENFEIKGLLGEGAYAQVYLANEKLASGQQRVCALKVGILENEDRFKREVLHMQLINHPNVLACWQAGKFQDGIDQKYWISMPNMGGLTLESLILGGQLDLESKLVILIAMINGMDALHQKQIVHRDLKPSNCLISSDFQIKISDFGLSKEVNDDLNSTQSRDAYGIGSPAYMSPEQVKGSHIGMHSDVWAIGIIAYELLVGDLPWGRSIKPFELIGNIQHIDISLTRLSALGLPQKMVEVIAKCLHRDFKNRYPSAKELKSDFLSIANDTRRDIRCKQFGKSWFELIHRKLIEKFLIDQLSRGTKDFSLNTFLDTPQVLELPFPLDTERLDEVLKEILQFCEKISLPTLFNEQIAMISQKKKRQIKSNDLKEIKELNLMINQWKDKVADAEKKLEIELKRILAIELNDFKKFDLLDPHKNSKINWRATLLSGLVLVGLILGLIEITKSKAKSTKEVEAPSTKEVEVPNNSEIEFVFMKGGSFMMGSNIGDQDEKPIHQVNINDFYISKTEITVAQYQKCVDVGVCSKPHWDDGACFVWDGKDWNTTKAEPQFKEKNKPVVCVDWVQSRTFARWIGGDLPSEAQWEYASRSGGQSIKYPWGNTDPNCQITNFNYKCHGETTNVCQKIEGNTEQGLCDMAGNVREWILDEWYHSYKNAPNDGSAWCSHKDCSDLSTSRVYRGGGWSTRQSNVRTTTRSAYEANHINTNLGFRVVKSIH